MYNNHSGIVIEIHIAQIYRDSYKSIIYYLVEIKIEIERKKKFKTMKSRN
jgi:hypothetical protein